MFDRMIKDVGKARDHCKARQGGSPGLDAGVLCVYKGLLGLVDNSMNSECRKGPRGYNEKWGYDE